MATARQATSRWKVAEASEKVSTAEQELAEKLAAYQGNSRVRREWWNDLLPYFDQDSAFSCALRTHVELGGDAYARFRLFRDASGLAYLVSAEFKTLMDARDKAVKGIRNISVIPDEAEILDGSDCQRCRNYFGKTGPVCRHCKLQDTVKSYEKCMYGFRRSLKTTVNTGMTKSRKGHKKTGKKKSARTGGVGAPEEASSDPLIDGVDSGDEIEVKQLDREQIDGPFLMIAKQMRSLASRVGRQDLVEVAAAELALLTAIETELRCINLTWNRHLELLKVHDELSMCISRVQLATGAPGEDGVEFIRGFELEDTAAAAMSAAIMAESELKAAVGTFNFYREQEAKIRSSMTEHHGIASSGAKKMSLTVSPVSNHVTRRGSAAAAATTAQGGEKDEEEGNRARTDSAAFRKWQEDMNDDCCIICREPLFVGSGNSTEAQSSSAQHGGSAGDTKPGSAVVLLPCAHIFHKHCICLWLEKREACVICKAKTKSADLIVVERPQSQRGNQVRILVLDHK